MTGKTLHADDRWTRDSFTLRRMKGWQVTALTVVAVLVALAGLIYSSTL